MKYCVVCRDNEKSIEIKNKILEQVILEYDDKTPNLVVAIGGDGTILRAAHEYPNAIVFGVHTGHLGFHANYTVNDIDVIINDLNTGQYKIEYLDLLTATVEDASGNTIVDNAINEVTIVSPMKVLLLDVFIDESYLETFRGTGLCISTPYGSTAYNKSLHGAVIDPTLKVIQLTEMAGINSNAYRTLAEPMVLSANRQIKLQATEPLELYITVDHISYAVDRFKELVIKYNSQSLKMGYHDYENFVERIKRTFLD